MLIDFISKICNNCTISSSNQTDDENLEVQSPEDPSTMKEDPCDAYDPHSYGKQQHPTIFWGSIFHLFKYIVGTGILVLPYASKEVGYGVAIFGIILVGLMYLHILHLLLQIEYSLCKELKTPNLTYLGVVQHTIERGPRFVRQFTPFAKFTMYFHYVFNNAITNAIFLIIIGENFNIILDHYFNMNLNIVATITVIMAILIPLALIRNLKFLAPMSMFTNIFNMINLILILTIPVDYQSSTDLKMIEDVTKFPYFFSLTFGAFMCTGLVIPLKNDLKEPKKFTRFFGVLNIAICSAIPLYCTFGILGYVKFGDHVQPNVLQNLPPDRAVSLIVLNLFSFAECISFILIMYTSFDTLWSNIFKQRKINHPITVEYILRIFLCVLPYVLAVSLPDFKIMAGLTGVMAVLMEATVPVILHVLFLFQNKSKSTIGFYLVLIKDFILMAIGSLMFSAALIQVIQSIIEFYT